MYWGNGFMMDGAGPPGNLLMFLLWIVVFIDLVLLGIWLWKQIQKDGRTTRKAEEREHS